MKDGKNTKGLENKSLAELCGSDNTLDLDQFGAECKAGIVVRTNEVTEFTQHVFEDEGALMAYLHEPLQDLLLRSVLTGISFSYHHGTKGGPTLSKVEVEMEHGIDGGLSDEMLKDVENNILTILKPVDYSFDIKFNIISSTFSITLL